MVWCLTKPSRPARIDTLPVALISRSFVDFISCVCVWLSHSHDLVNSLIRGNRARQSPFSNHKTPPPSSPLSLLFSDDKKNTGCCLLQREKAFYWKEFGRLPYISSYNQSLVVVVGSIELLGFWLVLLILKFKDCFLLLLRVGKNKGHLDLIPLSASDLLIVVFRCLQWWVLDGLYGRRCILILRERGQAYTYQIELLCLFLSDNLLVALPCEKGVGL